MPVTSSRSSIKRWPNAESVLHTTAAWAQQLAAVAPSVVAVGCFGSYARGEAGVGSDIDLLVVRRDDAPFPHLLGADVDALPVPADILHYTETELAALLVRGGRMARVVRDEALWFVGATWVPGR
jgi:uncharacterized protein